MMWLVLGAGLVLGMGLALVIHARSRHADTAAAPANGAQAMQACPECGNSIAVGWAFCPFCAQALAQDEADHRRGEPCLPAAGAEPT